ncbi:MAG: hypothetical protein QM778_29270 [Myxococcales bacterium]
MKLTNFVRQSHRWLSIAFTLASIANIVAMVVQGPNQGPSAQWLGFVALLPLVLLLLSGLYLFVLPYTVKRRELQPAE